LYNAVLFLPSMNCELEPISMGKVKSFSLLNAGLVLSTSRALDARRIRSLYMVDELIFLGTQVRVESVTLNNVLHAAYFYGLI